MSFRQALQNYLLTQSGVTDLVDTRIAYGTYSGALTGLLTTTADFADGETVKIGSRTYTFKTAITGGDNVDGNVKVSGTANGSIDNLVAAINLEAGAGSTYAAAMTIHAEASARRIVTATMSAYGADEANTRLATTTTGANATWSQTTLKLFPYVVINEILGPEGRHFTAGDGLKHPTYQIDAWSNSATSAEAAGAALFAELHGKGKADIGSPAFDVRSLTVDSRVLDTELPIDKSGKTRFRDRIALSAWHEEVVPTF